MEYPKLWSILPVLFTTTHSKSAVMVGGNISGTLPQAQAQLTSTAEPAKDFSLIISVSMTEYITSNCHPQSFYKSMVNPFII